MVPSFRLLLLKFRMKSAVQILKKTLHDFQTVSILLLLYSKLKDDVKRVSNSNEYNLE